MFPTITKHVDKVAYITSYLKTDDTRPLMIVGEKNTGKSAVLLEISSFPHTNLCIITEGEPIRFIPSVINPTKMKVLIHSTGTPVQYDFARFLNTRIVRFERDPECVSYF